MGTTIFVSFVIVIVFCTALAIGQFFGRGPITPKCNPGECCFGGKNCPKRKNRSREN